MQTIISNIEIRMEWLRKKSNSIGDMRYMEIM